MDAVDAGCYVAKGIKCNRLLAMSAAHDSMLPAIVLQTVNANEKAE
jgi:hypothetical protein